MCAGEGHEKEGVFSLNLSGGSINSRQYMCWVTGLVSELVAMGDRYVGRGLVQSLHSCRDVWTEIQLVRQLQVEG